MAHKNEGWITRDQLAKATGYGPRSLTRLAAKGEIPIPPIRKGRLVRYFPARLTQGLQDWIAFNRPKRAPRRKAESTPLRGISSRALIEKLRAANRNEPFEDWSSERLLALRRELKVVVSYSRDVEELLNEREVEVPEEGTGRPPIVDRLLKQWYSRQKRLYETCPEESVLFGRKTRAEIIEMGMKDPWEYFDGEHYFVELDLPIPPQWLNQRGLAGPPLFWRNVIEAIRVNTDIEIKTYLKYFDCDPDPIPVEVALISQITLACEFWPDTYLRKEKAVWETTVKSLSSVLRKR